MANQKQPVATPPLGQPVRPAPLTARRPGSWWRASLLILLAFALGGVVPGAVAGQFLGFWHLSLPTPVGLPTVQPSLAPDRSLPRSAWTASPVTVLVRPATGAPLARLEAGFPVRLLDRTRAGDAIWSHVRWAGPVVLAGGEGWVPEATLVAYGGGSHPIGDLGALSPGLAGALSPYGARLSTIVYFPATGQLYLSSGADASAPLGSGFRAMLLAALFADAEAHQSPPPATDAGSAAAALARGDAQAATNVYHQLGDAPALSAYLGGIGVAGLAPASGDPQAATATPRALVQFYTALATSNILTAADHDTLLALLNQQSQATPTLVTPAALGQGGFLVASATQAGNAWTANVGGLLAGGTARAVVVTLMREAPSASAAYEGPRTLFTELSRLLAK